MIHSREPDTVGDPLSKALFVFRRRRVIARRPAFGRGGQSHHVGADRSLPYYTSPTMRLGRYGVEHAVLTAAAAFVGGSLGFMLVGAATWILFLRVTPCDK
jgi:hypothetical protein